MKRREQANGGRLQWRGDWMRMSLPVAAAALAVAALLSGPGVARAATYKWVDDQGVIHYTDKVPPEAINKGNVELNKQGVPVRKTEPALTPDQLRAKAVEDERLRQVVKQQDEIARRDRALLATYTSESEIDLARNRSLQTIDSVVQSSKAYSEQLAKRRARLEARKKADYTDKPVPVEIERELESITTEIARQDDLIALKQRETLAVNTKYDADKKRWRELIATKGGEPTTRADAPVPVAPAPAASASYPNAAAPKKK